MTSLSEAIQQFVREDQSAREERRARRASWPDARERIRSVLEEVRTELGQQKAGPRSHVMESNQYENYGSIQLSFGDRPDGIIYRGEREQAIGTEAGAALVFGQGQTGQIAVLFYPFELILPNDKRRQKPRRLATLAELIDPADLLEDKIKDLVIKFLVWARSTTVDEEPPPRPPIGFAHYPLEP